jgi:hypothetical protein
MKCAIFVLVLHLCHQRAAAYSNRKQRVNRLVVYGRCNGLTALSFSSWSAEEEVATSAPAAHQAEAESTYAHLRGHHRSQSPESTYPQQTGIPPGRWLPHPAAVQEGGYAHARDGHDSGTSPSNPLRSPSTCPRPNDPCLIV